MRNDSKGALRYKAPHFSGLAFFSAIILANWAACALAQNDPLKAGALGNAPKLSATLTSEELSGEAQAVDGETIYVNVANKGKRALLLDGDSAKTGPSAQTPLTPYQIMAPPSKNTLPEDTIEVATSLGTMGVASVAIDAENKKNNPGPAFYGKDNTRRKIAEARFGARLLFPGETSSGEIFLPNNAAPAGNIVIPVYSHPDGTRLGDIVLSVACTPTGATSSPPPAASVPAQRVPASGQVPVQVPQNVPAPSAAPTGYPGTQFTPKECAKMRKPTGNKGPAVEMPGDQASPLQMSRKRKRE